MHLPEKIRKKNHAHFGRPHANLICKQVKLGIGSNEVCLLPFYTSDDATSSRVASCVYDSGGDRLPKGETSYQELTENRGWASLHSIISKQTNPSTVYCIQVGRFYFRCLR